MWKCSLVKWYLGLVKSAKKTRYRDGGGSSFTPKDAPSLCNYRYDLLSIPTKTKPHNGYGNTLQGPTACSTAVWFDSLLLPKREPPSTYV